MNTFTVPRLLLLETSGRSGFVALAVGAEIVGQCRLEESRRQARDVAPHTAELLSGQGLTARDLTGVVVSLGPGSYTGLRVGLISARVLAYATGCVLLGLPTFPVLAAQAPAEAVRVEVLADAQKDRVYHQAFERVSAEDLRPVGELAIVSWDAWAASCPAGALVTGPGALKFADRLPAGVVVASADQRAPRAESLLALALRRLARGERDDPFALEPLYLRPSSAEEQWDSRTARDNAAPL